ncbi:MAG: gliding motility lipoprotein GldH [Muribaculaceae bacterium]|nr:gliding motility lipoprotein GldH [Muribaculaceae bacterium]
MRIVLHIIALVLVVAVSCGRSGEYTGYHEIEPSGWPYGDVLEYTVSLRDSVALRPMLLTLTHDNSYNYSNLWLEVRYTERGGGAHVDTVNVEMCDVYGNWYGNGLPGHYQLVDTLSVRPVALADSSVVCVRHIMRVDTLTGISQIGIRY